MFRLLDLPAELLHLILSHLAHISIHSFFASRLTCKLFETNVQLILKHEIANLGCAIHALLQTHFATILDSSANPSIRYDGKCDKFAPLRRLPWAADPEIRERWLRPEATWRRLPLASSNGVIVRKMQFASIPDRSNGHGWISGYDVLFPLQILQRDVPGFRDEDGQFSNRSKYYGPPQSVTLGWLYDFVIAKQSMLRNGWQLHFEIAVRERAEFKEMGYRFSRENRVTIEVEEIKEYCEVDEECVLLFGWDRVYVRETLPTDVNAWVPEVIDEDHAEPMCF